MTLEVLSPEKRLFQGEVQEVTLPGTSGEFTVLHGHAPLVSSLTPGKIVYIQNSATHDISIQGGFAEVLKDKITVCTD